MVRKKTEFLRFGKSGVGKNRTADGRTLFASSSVGCDLRDGVLRAGVGLKMVNFPDGRREFEREDVRQVIWIPNCYQKGNDGWLVTYYDGTVMLHTPYETLRFDGNYQETQAVAVADSKGKCQPLLFGKNGAWRLDKDGEAVNLALKVYNDVACYFRDRLFYLSDSEAICYSVPTQPLAFRRSADDAGEIALVDGKGEVVNLMPYKDALYVFKEYAILRFVAVGAARDFYVETIAYDGGKIEGKSVVAYDGGLFFAAADGVYRFDGSKCVRLTDGLPTDACGGYVAAADGARYYLSYETEMGACTWVITADGDEYILPKVRVLGRVGDGVLAMRGLQAAVLCEGEAAELGADVFMFDAYLPLGNSREKTVTGVEIYGVGRVDVAVRSERKRETKCVELVGGVGRARLAVKGREFFCALRLFPSACVEKIVFEYQEVGGSV